jgi:hypothetical protein
MLVRQGSRTIISGTFCMASRVLALTFVTLAEVVRGNDAQDRRFNGMQNSQATFKCYKRY